MVMTALFPYQYVRIVLLLLLWWVCGAGLNIDRKKKTIALFNSLSCCGKFTLGSS
jgi:hypothetical protein